MSDRKRSPVGGFFGVDLTLVPDANRSVLDRWRETADQLLLFHNQRSALLHLLAEKARTKKVAMPAFMCPAVPQALASAGYEPVYFPIDAALRPDPSALWRLPPACAAILPGYFGRPADRSSVAVVRERSDILWMEDYAQSPFPSAIALTPYQLYSPRKICAVPDGGVLAVSGQPLAPAAQRPFLDSDFMRPALDRGEDPFAVNNAVWYARFQEKEAAGLVGPDLPISRLSEALLGRFDGERLMQGRRRNYRQLYDALGDRIVDAFESDGGSPSWLPFAFPIVVPDAAEASRALARRSIFAPRYWPALPETARPGAVECVLRDQLICLPCDQRYGELEMERIIEAVRAGW